MAYKVKKITYRPWPVTLPFLSCVADGVVEEAPQTFTGHFAPVSEKELLAIRKEIFGDEGSEEGKKRLAEMSDADRNELEARFFCRLLIGWEGVEDDDGALPYSAEQLTAFITGPDGAIWRRGLHEALNLLRWGIAPRKNSKASPAPGLESGAGEAATS